MGIVALLAVLLTPQKSESCGPWFQDALFTYTVHPQLPLDSFAAGRLGIIKPTYARSYLTVAYRHLMGKPLTKQEQKDAVSLWSARLHNAWSIHSYAHVDPSQHSWDSLTEAVLPSKREMEINQPNPGADTLPTPPRPDTMASAYTNLRSSQDYFYYSAVTPSAIHNATQRLLDLMASEGRNSEIVKDWITTQRLVFNAEDPSIPTQYTGHNLMIRSHRLYQRAAALFYRGRYGEARDGFIAVANDPNSPWQLDGLYLAARAMTRKGSLGDSGNTGFQEALRILDTIKIRSKHVEYLTDYIKGWTERDAQILRMSLRLQDEDPNDFEHHLDDYTKLLDRALGESGYSYYEDPGYNAFAKLPETLRSDDMTDWITTLESTDSSLAEHAFERWMTTKSMPWLIAALSKATSLHISYYVDLKPTSPAYESYVYYMAKLLHRHEDTEILRPMLDAALSTHLTRAGRNDLMRIRQDIATDMSDLVRMIARAPVGLTWSDGFEELPDQDTILPVDYDSDALRIINRSLPLSRLMEAIDLNILSGDAQAQLTMSAWSRAVVLGREDDAMRLSMKLLDHPILGPWMKRYRAASPGIARHREGVFIHLKHPGLSPMVHQAPGRRDSIQNMDSYRDNGWCKLFTDSSGRDDEYDYGYFDREVHPVMLPFLTPDNINARESEWQLLAKASPSPNYLAFEAVKWANASPSDRDVPEALHLAIRLSRYGCNDAKTGSYSKQAHSVLHKKYGKTKWADATPYWYD